MRGTFVFTVSVGAERNEAAAKRIETWSEVQSVKVAPQAESLEVRLKEGHDDGTFIPERLVHDGYRLKTFTEKEVNLENVFMEITKGLTA